MKHRIPALAAAVAFLLTMTAGTALATVPGTLDQDQTATTATLPPQTLLAQTFTAGLSGALDAVQVHTALQVVPAGVAKPHAGSITIQITGTDGSGLPTSTILASETLSNPADGDWNLFEFSPANSVVAGTKYAILIQGTGGLEWDGACADNYGPGTALIFDTTWKTIANWNDQYCVQDFAFRTYVNTNATPPPTGTAVSGPADSKGNGGLLIVFAGLAGVAAAAAFTSIKRRRVIGR
ncbi:MAG: hypothetical protein ABSD62_05930 [Candidatus Limnocylindrales bacterium]|jgi:hypothetical protein